MTLRSGVFDREAASPGWFSDAAVAGSWFTDELVPAPVVHFSTLAVGGGGAIDVAGSTREAISSASVDGDGAVDIAGYMVGTFSSAAVDGAGTVEIAGATRLVFAAVSVDGVGVVLIDDVTASTPGVILISLTMSPYAVVAVASPTPTTLIWVIDATGAL